MVEVEYVVVANNYNQVFWMKQMMKGIRIEFNEPVVIHCDNTRMVNIS